MNSNECPRSINKSGCNRDDTNIAGPRVVTSKLQGGSISLLDSPPPSSHPGNYLRNDIHPVSSKGGRQVTPGPIKVSGREGKAKWALCEGRVGAESLTISYWEKLRLMIYTVELQYNADNYICKADTLGV